MSRMTFWINDTTQVTRQVTPRLSSWSVCLALSALFVSNGSAPANAHRAAYAANSGEFQIASRARNHHRYSPRRRKASEPKAMPAWMSKEDSKDPVQIIVSLPEKKLTVYRGGKLLVKSRISSGRKGFETPSGVFSILEKNRYHRSNIYSGAPMPFMQRLTWSGIALHGFTSVPNVPASAGCVRLPISFANQLFQFTKRGAHVVVANEKAEPLEIKNEKLIQPVPRPPKDFDLVEQERAAIGNGIEVEDKKRSTSPLRILITRSSGTGQVKIVQKLLNELSFEPGDADGYMGPDTAKSIRRFQVTYGLKANGMISDELIEKLYELAEKDMPTNGRLYVRQNFKPVFDSPIVIRNEERSLGSHLFTAMYFEPGASETRWTAVTLKKGSAPNKHALHGGIIKKPLKGVDQTADALLRATAEDALSRIVIPAETRKRLAGMLTPGSSLAISDDGISWETTPKGTDFVVLMQ